MHSIVDPARQPLDAERVDTRCGHFNCERIAVESAANLCGEVRIGIGQFEIIDDGCRALNEQLNRGIAKHIP